MRYVSFGVLLLTLAFWTAAQSSGIPSRDASTHMGQSATVCGVVASARFASRSNGQPTFLNFDAPYPNEDFTVVIWGSDRANFAVPPEAAYTNRALCVTGRISSYRGVPEIVIRSESQIEVTH